MGANGESERRCVLCLRELSLFRGLDARAFVGVCLRAEKLRLDRGQTLLRAGEPQRAVYLVKTGKLKLVQSNADGRAAIVDVLGPGDILGETALFHEQPVGFDAVVLEDVGLCCFGREAFESLVRESPEAAIQIISYLARRLREQSRESGEASGTPVRDRLLRLLTRLAEKYGQPAAGGPVIELALTQQDLADMVGASRVMVANVLRQLRDEGVVARAASRYQLRTQRCVLRHFSPRASSCADRSSGEATHEVIDRIRPRGE